MLIEIGNGWAEKRHNGVPSRSSLRAAALEICRFSDSVFFMGGGIVVFSDNRLFNTR